jgi:hypothetical protein
VSTTPIIPGFHPDPSVCLADGTYYLVTSSFGYAPGIPLFRSTDLLAWEQVGNVLTRPEQLNVSTGRAGTNLGVYAPTIRHHDGTFWVTTTNIADIRAGHLVVRAQDPDGPWSDPVHTAGAVGVDPDLAWDEDGTCYLTWSDPRGGIAQAAVDPWTGTLLSEPAPLWRGTGLAHPEGPHLYAVDGWWYLVCAEGGTGRGHAVTVARSRSITGPFEAAPGNPVLTHRSTDHPVQSTGHADLVRAPDGRWAMVHLGTRPGGAFPGFHVNGRETFLAGVDWVDGWPAVDEARFDVPPVATGFTDRFGDAPLHPRWIAPGVQPATFAHPGPDGLVLDPGRGGDDREAARMVGVRTRDRSWEVAVDAPAGDVALVLRVDDAHWAAVERIGGDLRVRAVVGPLDQVLGRAEAVGEAPPLVIRCEPDPAPHPLLRGPDVVRLGYRDGDRFAQVAALDGRYLSTEVAGGFTGRVAGVEALGGPARIRTFTYAPLTEQEEAAR